MHSLRIEPISRSAYAFCHGERAEIGLFPSVGTISSGQQAFETTSDDCLGLGHDPVDQFLAGRNVMDEPGDHSTAPGARIQLAVLQDALISGSADEVANVFDRRRSGVGQP
jgi:hypothetical protein